ncbi:hypothetical protein F7734_32600 [Scytonema sp. UIC 10036]|uniref:hypothetical protein n=1 Tax=Scytonema sp. UIC 10036 TaxID=2304196 RepID=UPI0012DA1430|nr:hypothetical protein [Scytonema sp. UIC 10036]MUG96828.1 hypothetical protein [Scytonema sp. UIC 10036]
MSLNYQQKLSIFLTCLATTALNMQVAWADQLDFKLHNHTNLTIVQVYVSDSDIGIWEEDVLGRDVLKPGKDINIRFSGSSNACLFDIKVVFANRQSNEKYKVNLCTISNFYVNP